MALNFATKVSNRSHTDATVLTYNCGTAAFSEVNIVKIQTRLTVIEQTT